MMSLVYFGCLYMWQGGTLYNYIQSVLGRTVEEDKTPTGRRSEESTQEAGGYTSDGGRRNTAVGTLGTAEPLSRFSSGTIGGTFSSIYEQVPGDDEEGEMTTKSINSDGVMASISGGLVDPCANSTGQSWSLSQKDKQVLKRRTIKSRLSPLGLLSSFISDFDLVSDWLFLEFVLVKFPLYLQRAGLTFAIFGTVMWALATTEFALLSTLRVMWKGNPAARLEHVGLGWQLLANVFLEDLPQFAITIITNPNSVPGVLNIVLTTFSLMSKLIHGFSSTRAPSLMTQFHMIDADPAVTRQLFQLRDDAKQKAALAEKLVYHAWIYRCNEGEQRSAAIFQVMQIDPTFVNGDLDYMRRDLVYGGRLYITSCGLTGSIPTRLGALATLRILILQDNELTGTIPKELSTLSNLSELNLGKNKLEGVIPEELSYLGMLEIMNLSGNALTGSIPAALGALSVLKTLILSDNQLSGEIPRELGSIGTIRELDLSGNHLSGAIPVELGNLVELETLSVRSNILSGPIPMELGSLERLRTLVVANNKLSDAVDAEKQLKEQLHPQCHTDFLPQHEEEEAEEAEEGEEDQETEYASYA